MIQTRVTAHLASHYSHDHTKNPSLLFTSHTFSSPPHPPFHAIPCHAIAHSQIVFHFFVQQFSVHNTRLHTTPHHTPPHHTTPSHTTPYHTIPYTLISCYFHCFAMFFSFLDFLLLLFFMPDMLRNLNYYLV